jgi:hypothetical protein
VARQIVGAQHLEHRSGDRRALVSGYSVNIDGARQFESFDWHSHQGGGHPQASRRNGNAESPIEQRNEVLLRRDLAAALDINVVFAQNRGGLLGIFAIGPSQEPLLPQLVKIEVPFVAQLVVAVENQLEGFREKRPLVEALPFFPDLARNG